MHMTISLDHPNHSETADDSESQSQIKLYEQRLKMIAICRKRGFRESNPLVPSDGLGSSKAVQQE